MVDVVPAVLCLRSVVHAETGSSQPEQVTITDVKVRISDHGPVVLLQAEGKTIPIFVDLTVAVSIQGALNGEQLHRPLSHDLMHTIMETLGAKVTQSVITLKGWNLLWSAERRVRRRRQSLRQPLVGFHCSSDSFQGADYRRAGPAEFGGGG